MKIRSWHRVETGRRGGSELTVEFWAKWRRLMTVGAVALMGWGMGCDNETGIPAEGRGGEDECTNGVDDDFNGILDCAEPLCAVACEDEPFGVCCYQTGSCDELLEGECANTGGVYEGNGTSCSVNGCPDLVGACCTGASCVEVFAENCESSDSTFLGVDRECSPNPCVEATGACCAIDSTCQVLTEAQCGALPSNVYQGDGSSCAGACLPNS